MPGTRRSLGASGCLTHHCHHGTHGTTKLTKDPGSMRKSLTCPRQRMGQWGKESELGESGQQRFLRGEFEFSFCCSEGGHWPGAETFRKLSESARQPGRRQRALLQISHFRITTRGRQGHRYRAGPVQYRKSICLLFCCCCFLSQAQRLPGVSPGASELYPATMLFSTEWV